MGKRNYLVEGVSGTGKRSVCRELRRRGYRAVDGDRDLAYLGNPANGEKIEDLGGDGEARHAHHIWDVNEVTRSAANQNDGVVFFCGGSRNFCKFIDLFDEVFLLEVDANTLIERLDKLHDDDWGKSKEEQEFILHLHATKEDVPICGIVIDATQSLAGVVDELLGYVRA